MYANANKLQVIMFRRQEVAGSLNIGVVVIKSKPFVKLLVVYTDRALSYSDYITLLCQRAGKYTHSLSDISNELQKPSSGLLSLVILIFMSVGCERQMVKAIVLKAFRIYLLPPSPMEIYYQNVIRHIMSKICNVK